MDVTNLLLPLAINNKIEIAMKKNKKLFLTICLVISATSFLFSQTLNDQALVLQKCFDIGQLQAYYPQYANNSYQQLHVLQFPVTFPANLGVSKFGQPILFLTRAQVFASNPDAFFSFMTFSITGNTASVVFDFNYNRLSVSPSSVNVTVNLEKISNSWSITNLTLNNQ